MGSVGPSFFPGRPAGKGSARRRAPGERANRLSATAGTVARLGSSPCDGSCWHGQQRGAWKRARDGAAPRGVWVPAGVEPFNTLPRRGTGIDTGARARGQALTARRATAGLPAVQAPITAGARLPVNPHVSPHGCQMTTRTRFRGLPRKPVKNKECLRINAETDVVKPGQGRKLHAPGVERFNTRVRENGCCPAGLATVGCMAPGSAFLSCRPDS